MDPRIENLSSTTFAGKRFTRKQLCTIQETCRAFPALSRRELAHTISEHLDWCTPTGKHKIQSCLSTLESLEKLGIVSLPAKVEAKRPGPQKQIKPTSRSEQQPLIDDPLDQLTITVQLAVDKHDIELWNELLDRHHYLGYRRPIGPHLRYFIVDAQERKLGCLMFCYAVKSLSCRDQWIGWQEQTYKKHLELVFNTNRFLIFPWVKVKCLASKSLSMACKQLGDDWLAHYNTRPVLMETFVDPTKFKATSYRAANWQYLGQTKGQSATKSTPGKPAKDVYVFPLTRNPKPILINGPELVRKKGKANTGNTGKTPRPLGPTDPFVQLWQNIIGTVIHVAHDFDQQWQKRQRVLNSLLIMLFIFRLVFSTNKQGYAMTITELWEQCRTLGIDLPQSTPVAASAFCNARAKLDEQVFKILQLKILQQARSTSDRLWQGHRLFAVDGSKLNLPCQLILAGYKTPSDNAHYPQGLVSCLYQLRSKIPMDFDLAKHADERKMALAHLSSLSENDVVVYDRGYYSYEMLYEHNQQRIHPIFRLQMNASSAVDVFANSDQIDTVVHLTPAQDRRTSIYKKYPTLECPTLALRLVKYEAGGTRYILGTTLMDSKTYTIEDLSAVYHSRWGVEELYKISKQLMKVEQFHAHSERGVKQELFAHFVLITLSRLFANHSEDGFNSHSAQNNNEEHALKANFKNCIATVARQIEALLLQQSSLLSKTVNNIIASISTCRQRLRPNRSYARCSRKPVGKWRSTKKAKPVAAKKPVTA